MKVYRADLHIHTCLSPCADLDMSPRKIVRRAADLGLDILGISDHNTCDNVPALRGAAKGTALIVLGGMEICSREEVHLLGYFDADTDLFAVQAALHRKLQDVGESSFRDDQVIANAEDEVLGFHEKLLIGAVDLSLQEIVDLVHRYHGLAVASHADREGFGILGQLGFIPPDLPLDGVELRDPSSPLRGSLRLPLLTSSDAHHLEDMGRGVTRFTLGAPSVTEIGRALRREGGRGTEF